MEYIKLIVHTSKTQAYALLYTATSEQLKLLCEILYNLQRGVFPSSPKVTLLLQRYKRALKSFVIPPAISKRVSLVRKYLRQIYEILLGLKCYLSQL